MSTIYISNKAELDAHLENARGGETFVLAGGDYGHLALMKSNSSAIDYDKGLSFVAQTPADPPVFDQLTLYSVENVTLDGLKFEYDLPDDAPLNQSNFVANDTKNLTVKNCHFVGDETPKFAVDDFGTGTGIRVVNAEGLTFVDNELEGLFRAAAFLGATDLVVQGNDIHSMSGDGFCFTAIDGGLISGNHFHDFDVPLENTGHLDMIQFWVTTEDQASRDIEISDNFLNSGDGHFTQSIFINNEWANATDDPDSYYENFRITNNVIHNNHSHGITVGQAHGVTIANNTLLQNANGVAAGKDAAHAPRIRVHEDTAGVVIQDNISAGIASSVKDSWTVAGNMDIAMGGARDTFSDYVSLFYNALARDTARLDDFLLLPDGSLGDRSVGADIASWDVIAPPAPKGFITVGSDGGLARMTMSFGLETVDRSLTLQSLTEPAAITWETSDGVQAEGTSFDHQFDLPGRHWVRATVTQGNAAPFVVEKYIDVVSPVIVDYLAGDELDDNLLLDSAGLRHLSEASFVFSVNLGTAEPGRADTILSLPKAFKVTHFEDGLVFHLTTQNGVREVLFETTDLGDGQWHDFQFSYSEALGTATLYQNGAKVLQVDDLDWAPLEGNGRAYLGAWDGNHFTGALDNVAILDVYDTPEAVAAFLRTAKRFDPAEDIVVPVPPTEPDPEPVEDPTVMPDAPLPEPEPDGPQDPTITAPVLTFALDHRIDLADRAFTLSDTAFLQAVTEFSLSFRFVDPGDASADAVHLFSLDDFGVVKGADNLSIWFRQDGFLRWITVEDVDFTPQDWNALSLTYSAEARELNVFANGVLAHREADLDLPPLNTSGAALTFYGNTREGSFTGGVSDFYFTRSAISAETVAHLSGQDLTFDDLNALAPVYTVGPNLSTGWSSQSGLVALSADTFLFSGDIDAGEAIATASQAPKAFFKEVGDFTFSFDFTNPDTYDGNADFLLTIKDGISFVRSDSKLHLFFETDEGVEQLRLKHMDFAPGQSANVSVTYDASAQSLSVYVDGTLRHIQSDITGSVMRGNGRGIQTGNELGSGFDGVLEDIFFTHEVLDSAAIQLIAQENLSEDSFTFENNGAGLVTAEDLF